MEERETRQHRDRQYHTQIPALQPSQLQHPHILCKIKQFHSKLANLQFGRCFTCLEAFPCMSVRSVSTSSIQSECLRCTRDKHSPKLYSSANNMNPGVVPPQLIVCFYTSAILMLYYGLSLYLRSSALCHLGSNTSRRDACLGCDANYVHLPATTRSVWIQRTCHQPPSGCRLIFQQPSSTTFRTRRHHCEKRRY